MSLAGNDILNLITEKGNDYAKMGGAIDLNTHEFKLRTISNYGVERTDINLELASEFGLIRNTLVILHRIRDTIAISSLQYQEAVNKVGSITVLTTGMKIMLYIASRLTEYRSMREKLLQKSGFLPLEPADDFDQRSYLAIIEALSEVEKKFNDHNTINQYYIRSSDYKIVSELFSKGGNHETSDS